MVIPERGLLQGPGSHEGTLAGERCGFAGEGAPVWGIMRKDPRQKGIVLHLRDRQRDGRQARRVAVWRKLGEESDFSGEVRLAIWKT